ncbi:hypothetical protein [Burkholderia sp. WSM2232]|uniref:hypothetical protein n=1 Tax=Burkholderia sp. WSM2232 TaxID=944436 RepID=UPI0012EBDEEB|nr:hypothetical protein [Burkholderia sp. WSM2232]
MAEAILVIHAIAHRREVGGAKPASAWKNDSRARSQRRSRATLLRLLLSIGRPRIGRRVELDHRSSLAASPLEHLLDGRGAIQ